MTYQVMDIPVTDCFAQVYMSRDGLARFCTVPYEHPTNKNIHSAFMHLTNYSLNKKSKNYLHTESEVWITIYMFSYNSFNVSLRPPQHFLHFFSSKFLSKHFALPFLTVVLLLLELVRLGLTIYDIFASHFVSHHFSHLPESCQENALSATLKETLREKVLTTNSSFRQTFCQPTFFSRDRCLLTLSCMDGWKELGHG